MSDRYIFRMVRTENYTVLPNELIKDTRLSWEARGLLIYLLSQKPGWTVRKTDLERQSQANDFVISRILEELAVHCYIYREKEQDSKGHFEWITTVFDEPYSATPHSPTDGEVPHIVSTNIESTTTVEATKKNIVDAMLKYGKKGNGLEDYPADVQDLLQAFVSVFKRVPVPQEKSAWIAEARKWLGIGIKPSDIKPMYRHCKDNNLAVKSPFSITFAYDELRNTEQTHYRKPK